MTKVPFVDVVVVPVDSVEDANAGLTLDEIDFGGEMDATKLTALLGGEELAPDLVAAAVDFCVRIGLEADIAVTPGIDCDWEDFPELDDLEDDAPTLNWGDDRYGVRAYVDPKCVEIRLPWMSTGVVCVYLLEKETWPAVSTKPI